MYKKREKTSNQKLERREYLFNKPPLTRHDFLSEIVEQYIARRKALNLSQEEVDIKMGNADRQCSKWECGSRTPTSFNLLCWAEVLRAKLLLYNLE